MHPAPQIFPVTRSNCLHHERCSGGCLVVLAVAYALLSATLRGRMANLCGPYEPGAAARPVGIYDP